MLDLRGEIARLRNMPSHGSPYDTMPPALHSHSGLQGVNSDGPSPLPVTAATHLPSQSCFVTSPVSTASTTEPGRKRKRSQLELQQQVCIDFVSSATLSIDSALTQYDAFFQGCDRFIPIFDPSYDTFDAVRSRSGFLFNAICTIGSSINEQSGSRTPHQLNFELKKQLNLIVLSQEPHTVETVQALLVMACYSSERSLILSFATKIALELTLHEAFEKLTRKLMPTSTKAVDIGDQAKLTRMSRVWFGLLVLENILHVDAGKLPTFTSKGGARRCRVLLQQPHATTLDLRLLSQVELNYIRARIHDTLASNGYERDEDILDDIRDARIDIHLWFNDWTNVISSSALAGSEKPSLLVNLAVQRHWSDAMAVFRALKCLGTDNVDAMSQTGRDLLEMAKQSLKSHLALTIDGSNTYLANLRYSMDFVWAKCAFCFLLLLKLARLLPESEDGSWQLLTDGQALLQQLSSAGSGAGSSASRLYLQVLSMSLEKYGRALRGEGESIANNDGTMFFWESGDANNELQSFVPDQFIFEWDFPGLTLFSSPTAWQEFFDDFMLGFGNHDNGVVQPDIGSTA